jgi:hypothetical protein
MVYSAVYLTGYNPVYWLCVAYLLMKKTADRDGLVGHLISMALGNLIARLHQMDDCIATLRIGLTVRILCPWF